MTGGRNGSRWIALVALATALAFAPGCKRPSVPKNPAEMKEKLSGKVDWMLWKVDATDDQKARFDKLLDGLSVDLFRFQQESRAIKRRLIDVFDAEHVDEAELSRLQKQGVDLFDRYTKRMERAALDSARILTLKQRRKLVRMWKEWEFGDED